MAGVLTDRDAVEAADLQRRRVLAAFTTGAASDPAEIARRPNRALWGGVALSVVAALATGIATLLGDSVPKDWAKDGNVVVRQATGVRYLSAAGHLRPVRNDTSLALAGLPTPRVVPVDDVRFRTRPLGPALGIDGAPAQQPRVPADDVAWWVCERPGEPLALLTGGGPTSGGRALLAALPDASLVVVADGIAHPVTPQVAGELGYDPATARPVPAAFAALLPAGAPLARLPAAAPPPVQPAPPAPVVPPGTPAPPPPATVEPPAYLRAGRLVQDTGDDKLYVADAGQLRPVAGTTALRLLYGGAPPAPLRLSAQDRRGAPDGPPLEVPGFPASPPPVVEAGAYVCLSSAGGVLAAEPALPVLGLEAGQPATSPAQATVWQPPGVGSLVRADASLRSAVSADDPLLLVAGSLGFPLPDERALGLLGVTDGQVRPRPAAWLALIARGPILVPLPLG